MACERMGCVCLRIIWSIAVAAVVITRMVGACDTGYGQLYLSRWSSPISARRVLTRSGQCVGTRGPMLTGGRALHVLVPVGGAQSQQQAMKKRRWSLQQALAFFSLHPVIVLCVEMVIGAEPHDGCKTKPGTNKSRTRS